MHKNPFLTAALLPFTFSTVRSQEAPKMLPEAVNAAYATMREAKSIEKMTRTSLGAEIGHHTTTYRAVFKTPEGFIDITFYDRDPAIPAGDSYGKVPDGIPGPRDSLDMRVYEGDQMVRSYADVYINGIQMHDSGDSVLNVNGFYGRNERWGDAAFKGINEQYLRDLKKIPLAKPVSSPQRR